MLEAANYLDKKNNGAESLTWPNGEIVMLYRGYSIQKRGDQWVVYNWDKIVRSGFVTDKAAREWVDANPKTRPSLIR
jgi:hypothetical protein